MTPLLSLLRPDDAVLLVGHGSRSAASDDEMGRLTELVGRALPGVMVDLGFLEMSDPPARIVIDRLVARGARRVLVVPLILLAAGHAKSDVAAIALAARDRHPHVEFVLAAPLGVRRAFVEILGKSVVDAGAGELPLLVVARGSSDPDANSDAHKAARLVAEWTGAPFVHTGFTGITRPLVPDALDVFARLGSQRIAVVFWFLCTGRLVDRARADMAAFAAATGVDVVDAGYLGPDPRVVPVVLDRVTRALGASAEILCDACAYRAPWPGLEDRVGQAAGVGHSHLAAEHSHHHGDDGHHHTAHHP